MDDQYAKVTIEGTVPIIAGIAAVLGEHTIPDIDATIAKVSKGVWRLTFTTSPNDTFEEDVLAEWFTNVQATGSIDAFDPIEPCWGEDDD